MNSLHVTILASLVVMSVGCHSINATAITMKVREALPTLKQMMAEVGLDSTQLEPQQAWEVFKRFAARPVECASDGLLFQCGVYDFTGKPMFHFDFVRQFTIEKRGDCDHIEQLHIEFLFEPTQQVRDMRFNKWSFDFQSLDEFFRFIEAHQEFRATIESAVRPAHVKLYQERI